MQSLKEYRQLRYHVTHIKVVENPSEHPHLIYSYIEDQSKNISEGIRGRKQKSKVVIHH